MNNDADPVFFVIRQAPRAMPPPQPPPSLWEYGAAFLAALFIASPLIYLAFSRPVGPQRLPRWRRRR